MVGEGMFPGMGKMNPKQMQQMLGRFGIKTEEVKAKRVVFELEDQKIIIDEPNVTAMNVQGQKTYTVMGTERIEAGGISDEDVEMVVQQTNAPKEKAKKALEESDGDIAEAILKLKK